LDSVVKYIPRFGKELEDYEKGENEKPLTFHIKVMGAVAFRAFAAKMAKLGEKSKDNRFGPEEDELYREIIAGHVIKIENFYIDRAAVTNGEEFYNHPAVPNGLVLEIEQEIIEMNRISKEEAKN